MRSGQRLLGRGQTFKRKLTTQLSRVYRWFLAEILPNTEKRTGQLAHGTSTCNVPVVPQQPFRCELSLFRAHLGRIRPSRLASADVGSGILESLHNSSRSHVSCHYGTRNTRYSVLLWQHMYARAFVVQCCVAPRMTHYWTRY